MKALILILALVSSIAYAAGPIPQASIRTQDVNDICTTKTSTIRNVSEATKKKVYKLAGVPYVSPILTLIFLTASVQVFHPYELLGT